MLGLHFKKTQSQISEEEANINDSRVPQDTKLIFNFFPVTKDYTATGSKPKPGDQKKQEQLNLPVALTKWALGIRRSLQASIACA